MKDTRPFPERMQELTQKIDEECKKRNIQLVPAIISTGIQTATVKVIYVDMNDPEQIKKFGLGEKEEAPSGLLTN